ncbi:MULTISPECIES: nuclear transport factor 2 family protein [Sphingobium]|uniref:nuclear transport factor 2 family protein n=1 Tax=Sphingobium sp. MI1205 TaxID=407020 RepID=UPI00076FEA82|nr:nuclear transport factor 2 family protein [Sphingobium sp. MI1205]AMK19926.1 hypothetical protein K663_17826 [Sphingobium sp. MI1205]
MSAEGQEGQVAELLAREAIKELRYEFSHLGDIVDGELRADEMVALFTQDARFEVGGAAVQGHAAIREQLVTGAAPFARVMHIMTNPILKVAGNEASGRWAGIFPLVFQGSDRPVWLSYYAFDQYRKVDGRWLFSSIRTAPTIIPPEFK